MMSNFWRISVQLLTVWMPWQLRRLFLTGLLRYQVDPEARIGWSLIYPKRLILGPGARIGNLTLCRGIGRLELDNEAYIGSLNWISGYPPEGRDFFTGEPNRESAMILRQHACITKRHYFDCTNRIDIGEFTTIGGLRSQFLTHSIDIETGRQRSEPLRIGSYCFLGTGAVVLMGSFLPDYCVLGAKSVLNRKFETTYRLYAGVPAKETKTLREDSAYFSRTTGWVS